MYRSLHIESFRVFGDFEMESLARVNLIGGGNNVGKTALLEAIAFVTRPEKTEWIHNANHWRTTAN